MTMPADKLDTPRPFDLSELIACPEALACLSLESARRLCAVPVALNGGDCGAVLVVACVDVADTSSSERVAKHIQGPHALQLVQCSAVLIRETIEQCYKEQSSLHQLFSTTEFSHISDTGVNVISEYPVKLVNALLREAAGMRASDIHISPEKTQFQIRLRVDGVLLEYARVPNYFLSSLLVRLKIMANLDIAETRLPQDGQFRRLINGHAIDFRVSTFPTVEGENTVLRLINAQLQLDSLTSLNVALPLVEKLTELMQRPDGFVVVCGPTGSGKSTTLFALLDEIDKDRLSVMTLEDPVEHRITGVRQTTINASRRWGYADGLRALLRQDPDVLLIGEIRDPESCSMALRAVSTGHQVLTTVHASCAHTAVHRLRQLDAEDGALALGLTAVIAQRLVRRVCTHCNHTETQCEHCNGTGYCGRQVIMELLDMSPAMKKLLARNASIEKLQQVSADNGFSSLREQGMSLVASGQTTMEELNRVLGVPA